MSKIAGRRQRKTWKKVYMLKGEQEVNNFVYKGVGESYFTASLEDRKQRTLRAPGSESTRPLSFSSFSLQSFALDNEDTKQDEGLGLCQACLCHKKTMCSENTQH